MSAIRCVILGDFYCSHEHECDVTRALDEKEETVSAVHPKPQYIVLDCDGVRVGTITSPNILSRINELSGFEWRGRNYFYMPFHSMQELAIFVFQEVAGFGHFPDYAIEEYRA